MAPAVAGLAGIGAVWAWRYRAGWDGRIMLAALMVITTAWSAMLLHRNAFGPTSLPWALFAVAIASAIAALGLGAHRSVAVAVAVGVLAAIGGTTAFSIATPHRTKALSRRR